MTHPVKIFSDIIFPTINFIGFIGILIYFVRKPMKSLFASRSVDLEKQISEATSAFRKAEKNFDEAKAKITQIEIEKEALLKSTQEQLESLKRRSADELEKLVSTMKFENNQKLEEEIKKAQRHLKAIAAKKIIETTEALLKKNLKEKDHQRLANDFLSTAFDENKPARNKSDESKKRGALRQSTH